MAVPDMRDNPGSAKGGGSGKRGGHSAASLLWRGVLLFGAVAATLFAIFYFVPETNDYNLASRLKHQRLESLPSRKIVLIGGSNLAYGVDSAGITNATGCPVVNMGMNGYLGARFMFDEVAPDLKPGDIAVVAFEYDTYYRPDDGSPMDQLGVVKANPAILARLPAEMIARIVWAIPNAAQQKILRLIGRLYTPPSQNPFDDIETFKGFNADGDLVSHLGKTWPYRREDGIDESRQPLDHDVIATMMTFAERMEARGVRVMISYTPVIRYYYDEHRAALDRLGDIMARTPYLLVRSPPRDFVYDADNFFDTVYHLNTQGRPLRTARLVGDLYRAFGKDAACRKYIYASQESEP